MIGARRGLTLLEVLASTLLLALLAATVVPVLRQAMSAAHQAPPSFDLLELTQFAEAYVAEALQQDERENKAEAPPHEPSAQVPWPDKPQRPPVTVRRLSAASPEADHQWVVLSCDGWVVARWVPIEHVEEDLGQNQHQDQAQEQQKQRQQHRQERAP